MNTNILCSIKGKKGAYRLLDLREVFTPEFGNAIFADIQLVGAPSNTSYLASEIIPFEMSNRMTEGDAITLLAQEAVTVYSLDPGRVQRAADLMRQPKAVQLAHRDELDEQITPSLKVIIVKGSKGWYVTRRGFCQCPDHTKGYTCKHQIAAWMLRESTVRPLAVARNRKPAEILAELTA